MGEIHELFVLALSLVWFAGATPELLTENTPSPEELPEPRAGIARTVPPPSRNRTGGHPALNFFFFMPIWFLSGGLSNQAPVWGS